ncbi:hypothetical protein FRC12_013200, partial [Ceratobasidium sp. 428]
EPATSTKAEGEAPPKDSSPPLTLQSLLPAASALRPANNRPPLTVPSLAIVAANSSALTPATPVTPPASPPFRTWRLQPVNDETDADGDQASVAVKKARKGKEKSTEDLGTTNPEKDGTQHSKHEQTVSETGPKARREPAKLVVDVAIAIKPSGQPSATSGVDSILRSYCERTPRPEFDDQPDHFDQARQGTPVSDPKPTTQATTQAPTPEDEDEEEEKFDESFFASLARSPPTQSANWTPPTIHVPRTPGTIKGIPLDLILGGSVDAAGDSSRPPLNTTPRPLLRGHSLPNGVSNIQSLLAEFEGIPWEFKRNPLEAQIELLESVSRSGAEEQPNNPLERVHRRATSPPPPLVHRNTLPSVNATHINFSTLGLSSNPSADSIYRDFQALIDVLERLRRSGNDRPLRSLVGSEFSREFFANAGVPSFREYVNRAHTAGVVVVGGGTVQGREWISLNGRWQGINSGFQ